MRIAIVGSRFNDEITDAMVEAAEKQVKETGHDLADSVRVPGAFDVPLPTQRLLERDDVDGVAVLGAVVTGETDHDRILMTSTARTLQDLSLSYDKPVALGITGPGMSYSQAKARVHYASRAVEAVIEVHEASAQASGEAG